MTFVDEVSAFSVRIKRPAADVFAWHANPGALRRLIPPWLRVELLAQQGGIADGARVVLRQKIGPSWITWRAEHRGLVAGKEFRDVQVEGPFAHWEHVHRVEPDGPGACWWHDTISWRLPGVIAGKVLRGFVHRELRRMFAWRHAVTTSDLESGARYGAVRRLRILVTGASGMIGRALVPFLETQGHSVWRLVRRPPETERELFWDPEAGRLNVTPLEGIDAVIHLAGENVGQRWTSAKRHAIRESRVTGTRTLVEALARLRQPPAVFVGASGIGFYGDRGDEQLTEASSPGNGFLVDVCQVWEREARTLEARGVRVASMRLGMVLSPAGGALAKMLPVFRAGLGGRQGSGRQWISWVSIDDVIGACYHALLDLRCAGPVNVVAPEPVPNAEFAKTLARVLERPAGVPAPAAALRMVFGEMARDTVLGSARVAPEKLLDAGYAFRHVTLECALRHVLGKR